MKKTDWLAGGLAAALGGALYLVYRCYHRKTGFPITYRGLTYITCLSCGSHQLYDMKHMSGYGGWTKDLDRLMEDARAQKVAAESGS